MANQKTPTSLLLTPEGAFHSFGYTARDYYHDLDPEEARDWLYFEKFKMKIHSTSVSPCCPCCSCSIRHGEGLSSLMELGWDASHRSCSSWQDLTMKTELEAVNGKKMQALEVFAHALRFFKQHAVQVGPHRTQPGLPAPSLAFSLPERHVVLSTCLLPHPSPRTPTLRLG